MRCPVCHRCPFDKGVCEDRVNRGRRFFLMGALALPVARKLEALAPILAPPSGMVARYTVARYGMTIIIPSDAIAFQHTDTIAVGWALAT